MEHGIAGVAGVYSTAGYSAYPLSARGVREAYINPLISVDFCYLFYNIILQSSCKQNFLNTSNHFYALEMTTFAPTSYTFVPPSYTYVPTPPRSKSAAARGKPASGIPDKLHRSSKLSDPALDGPRLPATTAAGNDGSYRSGIQGMF